MARFDQYKTGFRARLNADWLDADVGVPLCCSLNASGRVVKGKATGQPGLKGLVALGMARKAGHPVDLMMDGEVLDVVDNDVAGTLAAGINIYAVPGTGALTITAASNLYIGFMVEIDRLIVHMGNDAVVL